MANTSIKAAFERMWQHVIAKLGDKANIDHNHNEMYYTESEIDSKISAVNTSITNITNGSVIVKEAEHAISADIADTATKATKADTATHATKADSATEATHATNANHATTADSATTAGSATKATQDGNGKVISSTYETKTDASAKLEEAKAYADSAASTAANTVKNDLLNGAGAAYDTLKELGDLIDENVGAIDALEAVAANKKDKDFIVQISGNETDGYVADKTFDEIVEAANNGSTLYAITSSMVKYEFNRASNTNAWFNSYTPNNMMYKTITIKSDNTVSLTSQNIAATQYFYGGVKAVAKTDTDTVEAKIGADGKLYVPTYPSLDEYYTESEINGMIADLNASIDSLDTGKADTEHTHEIADVTNLQAVLDEIDANIDTLLANKQIINISDQVVNNSFNFSEADGGLYWVDSNAYVIIANNGAEAGLFLVNKLTNTIAQVFCPISGHMYLVNNGIGSLLFKRLNTKDTYSDLTTTDKTVLGAINELDSELASHNHDDIYYTEAEVDAKLDGKANSSHSHAIEDVTNLQSALDGKANQSALDGVSAVANEAKAASAANTSAISSNTSAISAHTERITNLESKVGDGFEEITSAEIQALFA